MVRAASLSDLTKVILQFRDARNWQQFHNPKDMAISLSLETAEFLELMQWKNGDTLNEYLQEQHQAVGDELADILYWVLLLGHDLDIDLEQAFMRKMEVNELKYPAEKYRDSSKKYNHPV
jgi:NTP pyrophosphatase (non-canonical NTP hydrolase)